MEPIESVQNAKIKAWKKLHKRKERDKSGLFFIEGVHLVEEALKSGLVVKELILEEGKEIPKEWNVQKLSPVYVTDKVMNELCETETPQGYAAVCVQPDSENVVLDSGRFLLVDRVQDPGNLGAMIRTADACGLSGIILGEGTVDEFNGKVIRSSQGSIFHIPIQRMDLSDAIDLCKENHIPIFGTSLNGTTYHAIEPQRNFALVVGNEGGGVDEKWLSLTDQNMYIPIHGAAESLNVAVATGILLYHLRGTI